MEPYLVTFSSTHAALAFEAAFGAEGRLVPVPPDVRAGCGMALRFMAISDERAVDRVFEVARSCQVEGHMEGLYGMGDPHYEVSLAD